MRWLCPTRTADHVYLEAADEGPDRMWWLCPTLAAGPVYAEGTACHDSTSHASPALPCLCQCGGCDVW